MIDIQTASKNTDGDRGAFCQMAELFIEEGPKQLTTADYDLLDRIHSGPSFDEAS